MEVVDEFWPDITQHMHILLEAPDTLSQELRYAVNFLLSKVGVFDSSLLLVLFPHARVL